jgi:hypothetical protein
MSAKTIAVAISICLCFILGCRDSPDSPTAIPIVIQGDEAAKAAIESHLRSYSLMIMKPKSVVQIVEPDSDENYSILEITRDSDSTYSMVLLDPVTQTSTTKIEPELASALITAFKYIMDADNNKLQNIGIQGTPRSRRP